MPIIIAGKDCMECTHCSINEESKARVFIECTARDKVYYWGQCVSCNDKIKRKEENNE